MKPKTRKVLRFLGISIFVTILTLGCLTVAAISFFKQVVSRIEIDEKALARVMDEAVRITLREGTPQQKIDLIGSFADAPPGSASYFRPLLDEAAKDQDIQVREAATKTLERFNAPKVQP